MLEEEDDIIDIIVALYVAMLLTSYINTIIYWERRAVLRYYLSYLRRKNLINNPKIKIFDIKKNETPWSVDIYLNEVKRVKNLLKKNKIFTRHVYPPLNSQKIYKKFKNFPISEYYCNRGLWLPSSLDLTDNQIDRICNLINKYIN